MRVRSWLDRFSRSRFLILGIFVLLAGFFVWSAGDPATPTDFAERSSEYAFFNTSPLGETGGLAVPASCPSDLHDQPNYGQACSACNTCGQCNNGSIQCGGSCSASAPAVVADNSCAAATCVGQNCTNSCGQSISGTNPGSWSTVWGSCSSVGRGTGSYSYQVNSCTGATQNYNYTGCACPSGGVPTVGQSCTGPANSCGQTATGTIQCDGSCNAPLPPTSAGTPCQSAANSCGMRNNGTIQCSGACSASTPPDSACATCPNSTCGGGETCFTCPADCPAVPSMGLGCSSAPNACGMTNGGTTRCDGSCNATPIPDSACPPSQVCNNGIREGTEQCDNGGSNGSCPATCSSSCTNNSCGGGGVSGSCGWANGGSYSSAPSGGLCNSGNATSPFSGGGFWNWDCNGTGGGSSASCWAVDTSGGGGGGFCGDGTCGSGENCGNCSSDCGSCGGFCGDGSCGSGENCGNCSSDCGSCTPPPACDWTHYNCSSGSSNGGFDGGASWFWWCSQPGYSDAFCSETKPAPAGGFNFINSCTIPVGGSTCATNIGWWTSNASNVTVTISTTPQTTWYGAGGSNTVTTGPGSYTATLTQNGSYLASQSFSVSCGGGSEWDSLLGSCQMRPVVDLKINGQDYVTTELGEDLIMSWSTANTNASTTCTASGVGWAGPKNRNGGTDPVILASVTTDYVISCTKGGLTGSDSVHVEIFCEYTESNWTACAPPCTNGLGTQTQTITFNSCLTTNVSRSCTTTSCRDVNWKEIGQQD